MQLDFTPQTEHISTLRAQNSMTSHPAIDHFPARQVNFDLALLTVSPFVVKYFNFLCQVVVQERSQASHPLAIKLDQEEDTTALDKQIQEV